MGAARPNMNGQLIDKDNGSAGVATTAARPSPRAAPSTSIPAPTPTATRSPPPWPQPHGGASAWRDRCSSPPPVDRSDAVTNAEQRFVDVWNQMPAEKRGKFAEMLVAYVRSPLFEQRSPR